MRALPTLPATVPFTSDKTPVLFLAETFHSTVQGEGASVGTPATFLRFNGCDLACEAFCDTKFTWKKGEMVESQRLTAAELLDRCGSEGTVVLTGGEPLLQQRRPAFKALVKALKDQGKRIEVETAGHHIPEKYMATAIDQWNISPKLGNSGNGFIDYATTLPHYQSLNSTLKFVVALSDRALLPVSEQVSQIESLLEQTQWPRERVVLMPEGVSPSEQLQHTRDLITWQSANVAKPFRIIPRLHVLLWGNERGR